MFAIAILIGIYSYLIFSLGLLGFLYKQTIFSVSCIYLVTILFFVRKKINAYKFRNETINFVKKTSKSGLVFLMLLLLQSVVNFIGVLGPELGFDALWYHLTLPKIYLMNHSIDYIPGGLLYYSAMPKFTEMLYTVGLALGSEIFAKLIHFSFGILSVIALYRISRKFLTKNFSLLVLVLFYSNLVVGWMSITAYIDLARTFFEIMALWGFLKWQENKQSKWLIVSAVLLGLAISTKLLTLSSILIFTALLIKHESRIKDILTYLFFALFIPLPWFIFSLIYTGNPVYPFFTNIYPVKFNFNLINPLTLSDPISPFYVIFIPLAIFFYKKFTAPIKMVSLYSFLAVLIWYIIPQTGGGRFILPYLPAFSIVGVVVIDMIRKRKIQNVLIGTIIFFAVFSIIYRGAANFKYIPLILGRESKSQFLTNHLNFSFGDFYDIDGYFSKKMKSEDKVLLYGFHNLYYVNFSFIDSSWVRKGDLFNYIAVLNDDLPKRFSNWNLVYYNSTTKVKLYSSGGQKWIY